MCYIYSMLENNAKPIDKYEIPKMLNRFGAAAIDLAFYILLSLIILTVAGLFASRQGTPYNDASTLISDQIHYSKLAKYEEKSGYVLYSSDDYLALDDDNRPFLVNQISYFYLSYLTGENLDENLEASLDKNEKISAEGTSYLPKDYYNVAFINEQVLGLPKAGEDKDSLYFQYVQNGSGNDYSQIGIIKDDLTEMVSTSSGEVKRLKNDSELKKYLNNIYEDAVNLFYKQKSIQAATKTMNTINTILMFSASIPSLVIFYFLLPLLSPFGQTLGKRFLSLAIVDDRGYLMKKWQLLLRNIPILGATIYVCLIPSLYYQLLLPMLLLLISIGILIFNERRCCLHDLMARTTVIKIDKTMIIYPDEEHYEKALAIMKERDEANNGQQ